MFSTLTGRNGAGYTGCLEEEESLLVDSGRNVCVHESADLALSSLNWLRWYTHTQAELVAAPRFSYLTTPQPDLNQKHTNEVHQAARHRP